MARKPETIFREGKVDPFLKDLVKAHAPYVYQMTIQQLQHVGDPDKLLCIHGLFVAMELKKQGEEPSKLQAFKLDQIHAAGGWALCARPENWDKIKSLLSELAAGIHFGAKPKWRDLL